jgi:DNA-binding transcriptional ArsR family regulator
MFVYFVMVFPTLIVLLFFAILNWNPTVLYAPGDFEDEAMYLELIRLRSALKTEILQTLAAPSPSGATFTPQQIQAVSEKVDRAIDRATVSPMKQRVLELLSDGPKTSSEIAQSLGLSLPSVARLLHMLRDKGIVIAGGAGRSVQWTLSQDSNRDA